MKRVEPLIGKNKVSAGPEGPGWFGSLTTVTVDCAAKDRKGKKRKFPVGTSASQPVGSAGWFVFRGWCACKVLRVTVTVFDFAMREGKWCRGG